MLGALSDIPKSKDVLLEIGEDIKDEVIVMKALTWFYIIDRPSLAVIQRGHERIIEALYTMYHDAMDAGRLGVFPPAAVERAKEAEGKGKAARERVVIDLIASMTEASATEIYRQHLGVTPGSLVARTSGPL